MNKLIIKKLIYPIYKIRYRIKSNGWFYIGKKVKIVNRKGISFGVGVQIGSYCLIIPWETGKIIIHDNVIIGMFSRIACIKEVSIGKNIGKSIFEYDSSFSQSSR